LKNGKRKKKEKERRKKVGKKKTKKKDIFMLAGDLPHPTTGAPIPALLTWLQKN